MTNDSGNKIDAIIFIDGNNFYHNVKNMRIKPSRIDFKKLSEVVCSNFNVNWSRTRYYNSIPNVEDDKEIYWKHINFLEELGKLPKFDIITRKIQRSSSKELLAEKRGIIANLGLCKNCKPLVETNCYDCIGSVKLREKGIDVKIAVDMVEFAVKDKCNCIILVSGDADFIPALKLVEENKKSVCSAFLRAGYAYELRNNFKFLIIGNNFIMEKCLK
ncbi:MAG: NYN domain-containing protein [Candidatus Aenigmarchaeota archaeon]|nr:NYN domain-containing protein [Candidatus Aenigmarchaeota archaeon]